MTQTSLGQLGIYILPQIPIGFTTIGEPLSHAVDTRLPGLYMTGTMSKVSSQLNDNYSKLA